MNELKVFDESQFEIKPGEVIFNQEKQLQEYATHTIELLQSLVVAPETYKEVTGYKNEVSRLITNLENGRKFIKKEVMKPYDDFENKVKPIIQTLMEAKNECNAKLNEIDELERDVKRNEILNIWNLRIDKYPTVKDLVSFDKFITSKHLNKTVKINAVEDEMVEFLERVKSDLEVINTQPHADEIRAEYLQLFNLANSIRLVQTRHETIEKVKQASTVTATQVTHVNFKVGIADAKAVEVLLNANNIKYERTGV